MEGLKMRIGFETAGSRLVEQLFLWEQSTKVEG